MEKSYDIIIAGGGLAGLTAAILLSRKYCVLVIDPDSYPRHKMCGEYLSNEVAALINELGINLGSLSDVQINTFTFSAPDGKKVQTKLPLGGTGISRFTLDKALYEEASKKATFLEDKVNQVHFVSNEFQVLTATQVFNCKQFIMATGKRSNLDKALQRNFIQHKSPWLAVKMHYAYDMPINHVQLHTFKGGYAGLSRVENDAVNLCYLVTYDSFKKYKDITTFQEQVMATNTHLDSFFKKATPLWEQPITISQISFETKEAIENRIMMIGDTAGLIHPLCGNGMAMAIHSAYIASSHVAKFLDHKMTRDNMLINYSMEWKRNFDTRLAYGRMLQKVFLHPLQTRLAYKALTLFPFLLPIIIRKTHGKPIKIHV